MTDIKELFYGASANEKALIKYGFERRGEEYFLSREILGGQFALNVTVRGSEVSAEVYDREAESPYYLHTVEGAEGTFVGEVRAAYEGELTRIRESCFSRVGYYREKTANAVMKYAQKKHGTPPEYLWGDENCIMRRKDNRKWYLLFMIVEKSRLGLEGEGKVEVANMLAPKEEIPALIDGVNYLPAYHMNKKSWFTVPLDGRVAAEVICALADMSFEIAGKGRLAAAKRRNSR